MSRTRRHGSRHSQKLIIAVLLVSGFAASSCSASDEYECDGPVSSNPSVGVLENELAVAGAFETTKAFGTVETTRSDGTRTVEIEWKPAYTVTNITDHDVCVRDIRVDFPEKQDPDSDALIAINSNGGSRLVEIYLDDASRIAEDPAVTKQPPFQLSPGANVLVVLHQYFSPIVDGRPVPLSIEDDPVDLLGPLFGLNRFTDGRYQCAPVYSGIRTVVESNLGESTFELTNSIMPAGCVLLIPSR